jgi:hypothetical protein
VNRILIISRVGLLAKMRKFGIAVEPPGRGGGKRTNKDDTPPPKEGIRR